MRRTRQRSLRAVCAAGVLALISTGLASTSAAATTTDGGLTFSVRRPDGSVPTGALVQVQVLDPSGIVAVFDSVVTDAGTIRVVLPIDDPRLSYARTAGRVSALVRVIDGVPTEPGAQDKLVHRTTVATTMLVADDGTATADPFVDGATFTLTPEVVHFSESPMSRSALVPPVGRGLPDPSGVDPGGLAVPDTGIELYTPPLTMPDVEVSSPPSVETPTVPDVEPPDASVPHVAAPAAPDVEVPAVAVPDVTVPTVPAVEPPAATAPDAPGVAVPSADDLPSPSVPVVTPPSTSSLLGLLLGSVPSAPVEPESPVVAVPGLDVPSRDEADAAAGQVSSDVTALLTVVSDIDAPAPPSTPAVPDEKAVVDIVPGSVAISDVDGPTVNEVIDLIPGDVALSHVGVGSSPPEDDDEDKKQCLYSGAYAANRLCFELTTDDPELMNHAVPVAYNWGGGSDMTSAISYGSAKNTKTTTVVEVDGTAVKGSGRMSTVVENGAHEVTDDIGGVRWGKNKTFLVRWNYARLESKTCTFYTWCFHHEPVILPWVWTGGTIAEDGPYNLPYDRAKLGTVRDGNDDCVIALDRVRTYDVSIGETREMAWEMKVGAKSHGMGAWTTHGVGGASTMSVSHIWNIEGDEYPYHHLFVPGGLSSTPTRCPHNAPGDIVTDAYWRDSTNPLPTGGIDTNVCPPPCRPEDVAAEYAEKLAGAPSLS